ncbi:hypothetical protein WA026_003464 [Henosepilachna vigintioctopunctata]|uniref:Nucleoporin NUP53 n=1 Tax=Henosepilachna vigintioctopunctata TaxID=420089 RepID=A0AAW1THJ4_9CUCU
MEPMTLGSAPSSPSTPSTNPNFLPGFLMGDAQPTTALSTSPGRNRNTSATFNKLGMNTPEQKNLRQKLFNPPQLESTFQSPFVPLSEKGGPPKHGLFDSIDNKRITSPGSPILSSTIAPYCENAAFNESISRINDDSFNGSINMNMLNESARINSTLNRLERIDSNWITVFGFPPSAMSLVLAQLSNCGTIVEKLLPSQGNWVHLKFSNSNEVSRALTLNGKCISNSIMIGVHLYHNKENKENNGSNAMIYSSPVRARSLRQSFTSPQSINNSVVISQNVPQKSTGIVNKAIEYVFGW